MTSGDSSSVCGGYFNEAMDARDTVIGDAGAVYVDATVVH